ncbi:MAG: Ig-like domain-containing protein, partial [Lachnospiraceae bacterium]|nr:Ig-like domain-containing protein [Lachnospiraceae bacterium]
LTLKVKKSAPAGLKNTKYKAADFKWSTTDEDVVKVTNKGRITAVGRGHATVIASMDNGIRCYIAVTVECAKKVNKALPVRETKGVSGGVSANADSTIGSSADGLSLTVDAGTFTRDTTLAATPLTKKQLQNFGALQEGVFEEIISPVEIKCDGYKGEYFGGDITLTLPMGSGGDADVGSYVFAYYDEKAKKIRYLYPDSYDLEKGEMRLVIPHFSYWWGGKLTEAEQIDAFLDSYSMKMAVEQGRYEQAASELEPYLKKKIEALKLTEEAGKDLLQSATKLLVGGVGGKIADGGKETLGAAVKLGSGAAAGMLRAVMDDNKDAAAAGFEDMANDVIKKAWEELQYSERAGAVFKPEVLQDAASASTSPDVIGSLTGVARVAGRLAGGDTTGAMEELGGVMQGIHPAVELGTKGARFLGTCANTAFTYWKANEVEELYHIYKNGATFLFGNEVIAQNRESFLEYLNYSSGFTKAKGIARFYRLDKMEEIWQELRLRDKEWSQYASYEEMPESERNRLEKYAEDGLIKYFELRAEQESKAAAIKAREEIIIKEMMKSTGCLNSSNYAAFFGETTKEDYNLTARLERMVCVRGFISQYVDEKKLEDCGPGSWNYGDLMNEWVSRASARKAWNSPEAKQEAIRDFCDFLAEQKLLKSGMNTKFAALTKPEIRRLSGKFDASATVDWQVTLFWEDEKDGETFVDDTYVIGGDEGYCELSFWDDQTAEKKLRAAERIELNEKGDFSYQKDGVTLKGHFNAAMRTGSGEFTISSQYSKTYYTLEQLKRYFTEQNSGTEFNIRYGDLLSEETSSTYSGTFTISPSDYKPGYVQFTLNGTGKMKYSGVALSQIWNWDMLYGAKIPFAREVKGDLRLVTDEVSGEKALTIKDYKLDFDLEPRRPEKKP